MADATTPTPQAQPDATPDGDVSETMQPTVVEERKSPSMSVALFVTWILPVLIIAIASRFGVNTEPPAVKLNNRPISIDTSSINPRPPSSPSSRKNMAGMMMSKKKKSTPSPAPTHNHPTSYKALLEDIQSRNRLWKPKRASSKQSAGGVSQGFTEESSKESKPSLDISSRPSPPVTPIKSQPLTPSTIKSSSDSDTTTSTGASARSKDPERVQLEKTIERLREMFANNPNVRTAIDLADHLRHKDIKYHDGGMGQQEALDAYQFAIDETLKEKEAKQAKGEATNLAQSSVGSTTADVPSELLLDYSQKSIDGLLCALYTNMGKLLFMANMFERAVDAYTRCIEIEPLYLDAVGSRGSTQIILGQLKEAGNDFMTVIQHDKKRFFNDVFTGIAKVLVAKEEVVPGGWDPVLEVLNPLLAQHESNIAFMDNANPQVKQHHAEALNRLHHVLFEYHDAKTKNRDEAWYHLTEGYKHKMSVVQPYNFGQEAQKLATTTTVFNANFWPPGIGSSTSVPIFIIGFVRSGSTLLERVLDAHPLIVGTGEDSVFNGRLDQIRNEIVKSSLTGNAEELVDVVQTLADSVVDDMRIRWKAIDANTSPPKDGSSKERVEPQRFADKMLTNYFNVGFIHMLFPNALILHVARNPMDVLWSAFKHEFPPGGLDYTSEFKSLGHMYRMYRLVIDHWDAVLPGRVDTCTIRRYGPRYARHGASHH